MSLKIGLQIQTPSSSNRLTPPPLPPPLGMPPPPPPAPHPKDHSAHGNRGRGVFSHRGIVFTAPMARRWTTLRGTHVQILYHVVPIGGQHAKLHPHAQREACSPETFQAMACRWQTVLRSHEQLLLARSYPCIRPPPPPCASTALSKHRTPSDRCFPDFQCACAKGGAGGAKMFRH